jgi:hypothetical protein
MFIPPRVVRLFSCATDEVVVAAIQTLHREDAKRLIDGDWWTSLGPTLRDPVNEPDRHWRWRELVSKTQNKPYFRAACVKTPEDKIEGAMLLRLDVSSVLEQGKPSILIDRLATAPRHRVGLVEHPQFRGGGEGLLFYAIALSYSLGLSGRVSLFPIANARFYLDRGFVRTDIIEEEETLFELPAATAVFKLQERGLI